QLVAMRERDGAHDLAGFQVPIRPSIRVELVNAVIVDVDPPERRTLGIPDGALPEPRARREHVLDLRHGHVTDDVPCLPHRQPWHIRCTPPFTTTKEAVPMRALAVFPEAREVRIIDLPVPQATSEHDVTVRVREVGICATDRDISKFQYGAPPKSLSRL